MTRFDRLLEKLKNSKLMAVLLLIGVSLVAIGNAFDALEKVKSAFGRGSSAKPATGDVDAQGDPEQVSLERSALDRQSADSIKARRTELLSIIYDRVPCAESLPERCPPKASPRVRQEAVVEFLELERGKGVSRPDLTRAPLAGLEFIYQDFHEVGFHEANFSDAVLTSTNFSGADLSEANLAGATMMGSNLEEADLLLANLSRAYLWGAKFNRADLSGAVLTEAKMLGVEMDKAIIEGADLTDSSKLDQADLDQALGNRFTKLSKGRTAPSAWSTRESASSEDGEKLRYTARRIERTLKEFGQKP